MNGSRIPVVLLVALSSCGAATVAASSASSGSSVVNVPPTLVDLELLSPRTSPALVRVLVSDPEGDRVDVDFTFRRNGVGAPVAATLIAGAFTDPDTGLATQAATDPTGLRTEADGTQHSFLWDFAQDLSGGTLFRGVELTATIVAGGGTSRAPIVATDPVTEDLGNEPPFLVAPVIGVDVQAIEEGIVRVPLRVFDSLGDDVRIKIEYEILDPSACGGFVLARDAEIFDPTAPSAEFQGETQAVLVGTVPSEDEAFFWETDLLEPNVDQACDLAGVQRTVQLRFTIVESLENPDDVPSVVVTTALNGLVIDNRAVAAGLESGRAHCDLPSPAAGSVQRLLADERSGVATSFPSWLGPRAFCAADLDGDGDLDCAVADAARECVLGFEQVAPGVFDSRPAVLATDVGGAARVQAHHRAGGIALIVTGVSGERRVLPIQGDATTVFSRP